MARFVTKRWHTEGATGLPRVDRQSCEYYAYVPDKLIARPFDFEGSVAAEVATAEAAILRLNLESRALTNLEALARILLRAESVGSSRIEGIQVGARRLLRAELARREIQEAQESRASDILANIEAMAWAIESISLDDEITLQNLLEAHNRLLQRTSLAEHGGRVRTVQNWIGGSDYNPCSASFVPPPPEELSELLEDLESFCNTDSLPPVAQAAIAHAQFEAIHPFVDGNGRIGRLLIHLILKRRGLARLIVPPVSLILATWARDYVSGLNGMCYEGDAKSAEARSGTNRWVALFASACTRAATDASIFEQGIRALQEEWRIRLGSVRKNSSADLLIQTLPGTPVITANSAAALIGRSFVQTNDAISQLVEARILTPITLTRRNRAFEASEVVDAFADLERQLAMPPAETMSRRVPAPRRR